MKSSASGGDPSVFLQQLAIERSVADHPYTREIAERAALPVRIVGEKELATLIAGDYPDNLQAGKRTLLLCRNPTTFLKPCPSTREYRCCSYQVINIGTGCPMDCVYCILQAYLNTPYLTFFVNTEDLLAELAATCALVDRSVLRIGTGEFTDSMALDRITGLSRRLVSFFAGQNRVVLELKSKAAYVDYLADCDHNGRTIMAWSLNAPAIAVREELRTASLDERLRAAARCASWGYPLAFHFDPIIDHPGWRQGYRQVIDDLFAAVPAAAIKWISLGAFRFIPKLKQIGISRFPRSEIYHHEFVPGLDGKQRYFRTLRVEMYQEIYAHLQRYCDPRTCIYFCMESDEIWRAVMGFCPAERGGLPAMLDRTIDR
ncbi:SPL family radical SAM protein [Desulfofustis glycolicus]|uniref:Spore photoproduct lyase n=1 Tax=Desulfofustis glycolicus DSM 9705 TaxID=1121409 RepID=A0A1M5WXB6_9BACT|nr:radical SAM protein [Desulfofustis glycolicus]MCB2214487.1 radical SAM protein [Desulfobulbaceae bacterium]SHH91784.1 spore photoproduct lyase [Desulfofustis glycolicus DSM 9705]